MISINICNAEGAEVGKVEFDEDKLGGSVHRQALREAVLMHQARCRVGSAATKTRSEVKGSGHKPWRQKGSGRARAGSRQSPIWRGGGAAFGPKPRDYSYSIPKKVRRRAVQSALLAKLNDDEVTVIDALSVPVPKTKFVADLLKALGIEDSCLIVTPALTHDDESRQLNHDVNLAARNIPGVAVLPASDLNAYDLVVKSRILITKQALDSLLGE